MQTCFNYDAPKAGGLTQPRVSDPVYFGTRVPDWSDDGEGFTLVVVESPYAGDVEKNLAYLRDAMADCLARNEAPFASHALYTQPGVLDDSKPEERKKGMAAGFEWATMADKTVVYTDLGMSRGMEAGIAHAKEHNRPIEYRSLPKWAKKQLLN